MAANTAPIFTKIGDVSSNGTTGMAPTLTTAAADYTGISTNNKVVFTADATNGGYVDYLRMKAVSTNVATVARIYINNGSVNTSATNNSFWGEVTLPATTANAAGATVEINYPMKMTLNPGFTVYVGLGTTVASGWVVTAVGGKY